MRPEGLQSAFLVEQVEMALGIQQVLTGLRDLARAPPAGVAGPVAEEQLAVEVGAGAAASEHSAQQLLGRCGRAC